MPEFTLHHGNCLDILKTLPSDSVDSIVTDPPYGLKFMGKRWDYDVPTVEIWAECLRVLKPGGHLLAFAGTRTQHRMAVRIEDAGFEIRDMIAWVYGSGFPKSHNLGGYWQGWGTALKPAMEPITVARKPLIGTVAENALKHETGALNIDGCRVATEDTYSYPNGPGGKSHHYSSAKRSSEVRPNPTESNPLGRWPANLIHDGSEEVLEAFPQAPGQLAKAAEGGDRRKDQNVYGAMTRGSNGSEPRQDGGSASRFFYCAKAGKSDRNDGLDSSRTVKHATGLCKEENMALVRSLQRATSGSTVTWHIDESGGSITGLCPLASLSTTLTVISKITTSEIFNSWTPSPISESIAGVNSETADGGSHAENVEKSKMSQQTTTSENQAESARGVSSVVSKMLSSISDAGNWTPATNFHATVKPTNLMRYLCRLVTPSGGVVLDPFMGSGSTGKAAILEGFQFIGIELDQAFVDVARGRIYSATIETP